MIGEEIFTEHFEDLAGIYTYSLFQLCSSDYEIFIYDQMASYECFVKVIPFLMNVLAHVVLQFDAS